MNKIEEKNLFFEYLENKNFQKRLDKLNKHLKNRTILVYGTGMFFEAICKNYNLKKLNIVGVSDKKFAEHSENETFCNYKVYSPSEIKFLKIDTIIVATKNYVDIIEELKFYTLKEKNLLIIPFIKIPLIKVLEKIWS